MVMRVGFAGWGWSLMLFVCLVTGFVSPSNSQTAELPEWKPGDKRKYSVKDRLTGLIKDEQVTEIFSVDAQAIVVNVNGYKTQMTREFNERETQSHSNSDLRLLSFPLSVGKAWSFKTDWKNKAANSSGVESADVKVASFEKVQTPAGEFDAFRIESVGYWDNSRGRRGRLARTLWFAPSVRTVVKYESDNSIDRLTTEVVEIKLAQ